MNFANYYLSPGASSRNLRSTLSSKPVLLILTYEAPGALLHDLDAEGARGVGLVAIALHRDVSLG